MSLQRPDLQLGAFALTKVGICNTESYMTCDSRLSGVLHVLLHMAEHHEPVTSDALARVMQTNPVVIRRVMAGLRERGYVRSERGHGGGWTIARDLATVTLRDIYEGIGAPSLFAIGNRSEASDCAVEQAVNTALDSSLRDAEALLLASFGRITLASLSADFHQRLARRNAGTSQGHEHGA
jgi:DNA-binding IscR family transcriptional regulator